ncbi:MAG TPA: S41 family peptidase [Paucimonas sp.]|nr:S41 family peptidase [Paucimonas sp.]
MKKSLFLSAVLLSLLAGCGGGGGSPGTCVGSAAVCSPPPNSGGNTQAPTSSYIPKEEPAALANICTPEGEKKWVRAHLHDVYLWYKEIVDVDPARYASPADYFYALVVRARDRFSFTDTQQAASSFFRSGVDVGYGAELVVVDNRMRVAYVEDGTSASLTGITRGAEITAVNGTPIGNLSRAEQIAALYPDEVGTVNNFTILDPGSTTPRTVQWMAAGVIHRPVWLTKIITTSDSKRVGYMVFNDHIATAENPLIAAFTQFQQEGIDDLVLDLRYNGGGYLYLANEVAAMIGGDAVAGQVFERLRFNDKHPEKTNDPRNSMKFFTTSTKDQPLPRLNLKRVFVLTGRGTCSASESIINGLSPFVQVITIGGTTCGKPYGMLQANNCGRAYFAVQFEGVNALNQGGYVGGFGPNCPASDDLEHPLGDTSERLLATALGYSASGSCPATSFTKGLTATYAPLSAEPLHRPPWRENRVAQ